MTRKECIDTLGAKEKLYTRSLIGKAYDQGMQEGTQQGYDSGFAEANRYATRYMTACACLALRDVYGFGTERMQRFADAFSMRLLDVSTAEEAMQECEERFCIQFGDDFYNLD